MELGAVVYVARVYAASLSRNLRGYKFKDKREIAPQLTRLYRLFHKFLYPTFGQIEARFLISKCDHSGLGARVESPG